MQDYRVLVGAFGWQHPSWEGNFYPPDLPVDWQLGFYGNEFRVVQLPESSFPRTEAHIDALLEQSGDSPVFILEWPSSWCMPERMNYATKLLARMGDRLLGIIMPMTCANQRPEQVQELAALYRVCIAEGQNGLVKTLHDDQRIGYCWNGEDSGEMLQHGKLAIAHIQSKDMTLKKLRLLLEQILSAQDSQRYLAAIFTGDPPSIAAMRQATTILEML